MFPNYVLFLLIGLIIVIDYMYEKRYLGIVILHNNDHTLNKVLQFIMGFMNRHEIHYQILVIKEKNSRNRSTGYLFNIGARQLPGFSNYLFIDTTLCDISNLYKLNRNMRMNTRDLFIKNGINQFDKLCGVAISRNYFKSIDGFSNRKNNNFDQFIKSIGTNDAYGGYLSMNLNSKYDIVDRTMINQFVNRITIKYA
jgi:hypothetical protein